MTKTKEELIWYTLPDFPDYEINQYGAIYNNRTGSLMRVSPTNHGHQKISLLGRDGIRHTRSVAVLVADAFVDRPSPMCDHVIVKDGNLSNVSASNLAWRPRGFSWEYTHQLKVQQPLHYCNLRVTNLMANVEYTSIVHAGMVEGLLFKDIWRSTYSGSHVYPYGHVFEISERV